MSVATEPRATSRTFIDIAKVAIAQLHPDAHDIEQSYVEGSVALIWPYSSSTRRISLLLAEKDIRLRKSKGQVKVTFHGESACEVAKTHVGIGDGVKLALAQATWSQTGEDVSTPGKKVDWDIDISNRAKLEIDRGDDAVIALDFTARAATPSKRTNPARIEIRGPRTDGFIEVPRVHLSATRLSSTRRSNSHIHPRSFLDASLDPFAAGSDYDGDGHIIGRGRKRTKFARHSGSWQLLDSDNTVSSMTGSTVPSSPTQEHGNGLFVSTVPQTEDATNSQSVNPIETQRNASNTLSNLQTLPIYESKTEENLELRSTSDAKHDVGDPAAARPQMAPPPFPASARRLGLAPQSLPSDKQSFSIPKPVIGPLPSPGLALVSPLAGYETLSNDYFQPAYVPESVADPDSQAETDLQDQSSRSDLASQADVVSENQTDRSPPHLPRNDSESDLIEQNSGIIDIDKSSKLTREGPIAVLPNSGMEPIQVQAESSVAEDPLVESSFVTSIIDLEALQQEIEDASGNWNDEFKETVPEDEDMYGPPVQTQTSSKLGETFGTVDEGLRPISSPMQSISQPGVPQRAEGEETHTTMVDSELVQMKTQPIIINNPSDNVQRMKGNGHRERPTDSMGEAAHFEHVMRNDASDDELIEKSDATKQDSGAQFEVDEGSELPKAAPEVRGLEDMDLAQEFTATENLAKPDVLSSKNLEIISRSSRPGDTDPPLKNNPQSSWEGIPLQSDGMTEPFEDENQRMFLRAASASPINGPQALQSILFEEGDVAITDRIEAEYSPEELEFTQVSKQGLVDNQLSSSINYVEDGITLKPVNDKPEISAPMIGPSHPFDKSHFQIITPDPTQQPHTSSQDIPVATTGLTLSLPPSPQLTQGDIGSVTQNHHQTPLPQELHNQQSPSALHSSQRLSRKSFNVEKISTEYFTPRRSSRLTQSTPNFAPEPPPTVQRSISPVRPKRILRSSSPIIAREPSMPTAQLTQPTSGIFTSLSYFPHLSILHEHYGQQVDVMAVCAANSTEPQKAKSGPKDFHTTLFLVDLSVDRNGAATKFQIFRPRRAALPTCKRGDVVLLRNMKVQTTSHQVILLSTESSAWAVFSPSPSKTFDVTICGPPLEYDDAETVEAGQLFDWWLREGEKMHLDLSNHDEASKDKAEATQPPSMAVTRSRQRQSQLSKDPDGPARHDQNAPDINSQVVTSTPLKNDPEPTSPGSSVTTRYSSATRESPSPIVSAQRRTRRRGNSERSDSVTHQLRDGTVYPVANIRQRSTSVIHELRDGHTYVDD